MAVRSCWILAGTGTRCRIRRSRASQTCSMGDMSGEYAGHARTGIQTMNYVGQLAGQVFVQVKELYRGLNPATLSGCIDVIVVRQPDGTLQCSPFHVRFGKMGVLRSREKVVDIEINGEPVSLHMKLGENGEAFFVKETESDEEMVPSHLATSPIISEGSALMQAQVGKGMSRLSESGNGTSIQTLGPMQSPGDSSVMKKRRKRRRKSQVDSMKREDNRDFSEDEDMFAIDMSSDDDTEATGSRSEQTVDMEKVFNLINIITHDFCVILNLYDYKSKRIWLPFKTSNATLHQFLDKRSRHLGSDGVYLDDITELEPEVAALYFPKSDGATSVRGEADPRSANQSPQSVGSSGMDSGVDSFSDQLGDLPHIAISLCGGLSENREITKEFEERAISYQEFADNPSIIDDPNLVVKIGTKYYNWTTAAPIVLAMQVFQKPLPKATVENIMKEKMPKKGGRWWFSWRGRNNSSKSVCFSPQHWRPLLQEDSSFVLRRTSKHLIFHRACKVNQSQTMLWKPTLQACSSQASLHLKDGPNDVVFSVTTQYQGTCRCEGTIYLWTWDDKIVISDIDGTITRSDTLGHILPTLGKDWTHQGIARLYHRVSQNGYKFMYCSARAIGMADMTRGYLHWVNERGTMLPMGPVLLSPSSLFSAFHREVIEKKPEKFKIECLTDIKNLFYPNTEPFYAAFGNRATDVYSYKEVGVPLNRIFTVNPKGELIQEHAKTNISSYERLCEVVDHVFPLLIRGNTTDFPCSDTFSQFTFWREQLPEVDKQDQHAESS
uniref:phosphatidate phosphatase n=2 Tax=Sinocyclocheilus grahami TaxID=75366 RepID=A0A672RGW3_SINGR